MVLGKVIGGAWFYTRVLLFLVTLLFCSARGQPKCDEVNGSVPDRCGAAKLLWSWLNVTTAGAERTTALVEQIKHLQEKESIIASGIENLLKRSEVLLNTYDGEHNADVKETRQKVLELNRTYTEAAAGRKAKCETAMKRAQASTEHTMHAYYTIRVSSWLMTPRQWVNDPLDAEKLRKRLDSLEENGRTCTTGEKVAKTLQQLPQTIGNSSQLDDWKTRTMALLTAAAKELQQHQESCNRKQLDNLDGHTADVKAAVAAIVDDLRIIITDYENIVAQMNTSALKVKEEEEWLVQAERTIKQRIQALRHRLCNELQVQAKLGNTLVERKKQVLEARKISLQLTKNTTNLMRRAEWQNQEIETILEKFMPLRISLGLTLKEPTYPSKTVTGQDKEMPLEKANMMVMNNARTTEHVMKKAEEQLKLAEESLMKASSTLKKCEQKNTELLGTLAARGCTRKSFVVSDSSFQSVHGNDFGVHDNNLLKTQDCTKELESAVTLVVDKMDAFSKETRRVSESLENANKLEQERDKQIYDEVARVSGCVIRKMCEAATHLQQLRHTHHQLEETAAALTANISNASQRTETASTNARYMSDLQPDLVHELSDVLKKLEEAGKGLKRNIDNTVNVVNQLEKGVYAAAGKLRYISAEHENMLRKLPLNLNDISLTGNCNEKHIADSSQPLPTERNTLARHVTAIAELGETVAEIQKVAAESQQQTQELGSLTTKHRLEVEKTIEKANAIAAAVNNEIERRHREAFAQELHRLTDKLCASVKKIHQLHENSTASREYGSDLKNKVSNESRFAKANWQKHNDAFEMPQEVEDGFTYALRGVAVLEKHLKRADAQYTAAANDLVEGLKGVATSDAKMYDAVGRFVRSITLNLTDFSSHSLCNKIRINELVASLLQRPETMLQSAPAVEALRKLEARVTARLAAAREQMKKVASSAADAQAAVEEATRRARDAAAGRRCTPLHRQLLNVLQHIW